MEKHDKKIEALKQELMGLKQQHQQHISAAKNIEVEILKKTGAYEVLQEMTQEKPKDEDNGKRTGDK